MWLQIKKQFDSIAMQATDGMWNADVISIPNTKNGQDITLALTICDETS